MDIEEVSEVMNKLDETPRKVFQATLIAERIDLVDGDGDLTDEARTLADDIVEVDRESLDDLQDLIDNTVAVGPLLDPGEYDIEKLARAERRIDAFVDAYDALEDAEWDKDVYDALSDFAERV